MRRTLVDAVERLDRLGLNRNSSGNLGARCGDILLVTPSGIPSGELTPDDLVALDHAGEPVRAGQRIPTSEWRLHVALLARRPDIGAVVHTHSPEATAAATIGAPLVPIHYVAARFAADGVLRCAPYATYGSEELAEQVAGTLGDGAMACLMANHGAVAVGADLARAVALAIDVEWFCAVSRRASQLGEPVVLDEREIARVAAKFESYGQPGG